jgi:hypothetical protein
MALGIQIDQERLHSHLGQTKSIGGGDAALSCPSFEIEKELFPDGLDERGKSKIVSIFGHILGLVIALLLGIPFGGRGDPFGLFLKKLLLWNPKEFRKE